MSLSVYLKPTNYCTVGCEHCYLPEVTRANKFTMGRETLAQTARMLIDMAKMEGHRNLHIIWHGGEPMMLKPEWYKEAIGVLDEVIGRDYYTQSFQTSLIPYRSEWAELIHERFESFIGSSIDFSQRKIKSSPEKYMTLWMKKVELARKDGIYIVPGMVPTKNEINKSKELIDWFVENDFNEFNIERYSRFGEDDTDWPENAEHSHFLSSMFEYIMERSKNGLKVPYVKAIASGINGVLLGIPGDRWGGACQRQFLVVEPDGSLNSCPDRALHEKPFGNVHGGAESVVKSDDRRKWIRIQAVEHKRDHCFTCEYKSWCKSGCPITPNGPKDGQDECSGYKSFLNTVKAFCQTDQGRELAKNYARPLGQPIFPEKQINER